MPCRRLLVVLRSHFRPAPVQAGCRGSVFSTVRSHHVWVAESACVCPPCADVYTTEAVALSLHHASVIRKTPLRHAASAALFTTADSRKSGRHYTCTGPSLHRRRTARCVRKSKRTGWASVRMPGVRRTHHGLQGPGRRSREPIRRGGTVWQKENLGNGSCGMSRSDGISCRNANLYREHFLKRNLMPIIAYLYLRSVSRLTSPFMYCPISLPQTRHPSHAYP